MYCWEDILGDVEVDVLNNSRLSQTLVILGRIKTIILKEVILQLNYRLQQSSIADIHHVYCGCGKKCKGLCGLKTHQRTCRFVMGLNEELIQPEQDNELETNDIEDLISTLSNPDLKPGVKLPQTEPEWAFTEDFLRSHLNIADIQSDSDLDALITNMNDTIYGFLAKNYGLVERGHNIDRTRRHL